MRPPLANHAAEEKATDKQDPREEVEEEGALDDAPAIAELDEAAVAGLRPGLVQGLNFEGLTTEEKVEKT